MKFASRADAGRRLGRLLREQGVSADVVLGLPRGGVVVAAQISRELRLPLEVLPVRKVGHPLHRELAVGALAERDVFFLDELVLTEAPVSRSDLDKVIAEESIRLRDYISRFHIADAPVLDDKAVLLVDDGLATGATAAAAVLSARRQKARRVIVAAPVASASAFERLKRSSDDVIALLVDPALGAVGQYYEDFAQTTDAEVLALLRPKATRGR